ALPQGDARRWPARHRRPVGRLRHLEVIHASDVLDNAVACVVPDIHAKSEMGLGLHRGQIHWAGPRPALFITHVVASRSLPRLLRALPAQPSREAPRWGRMAARNQTRRLSDAGAP